MADNSTYPVPRYTWRSYLIRWIATVGVGSDNRKLRTGTHRTKPLVMIAITNWNDETLAQILVPPDQFGLLQEAIDVVNRKLLDEG